MKRPIRALAGGVLAVGIAGGASLLSAGPASAVTPAAKATITGYTGGSWQFGPDKGGTKIFLNGICLGLTTYVNQSPVTNNPSDNCSPTAGLSTMSFGGTTIQDESLTNFNNGVPGFYVPPGNNGERVDVATPAPSSKAWSGALPGNTPGLQCDFVSSTSPHCNNFGTPYLANAAGMPELQTTIVWSGGTALNETFSYLYVPDTAADPTFNTGGLTQFPATAPTLTLLVNPSTSATVCGANPTPCSTGGNLSLTKSNTVVLEGTGYNPGMSLIITVCNADGSLISPLYELAVDSIFKGQACGPVNIPTPNIVTVSSTGSFIGKVPLPAGQIDPLAGTDGSTVSPNAVCPINVTQAAEGVNCIAAVAEIGSLGLASPDTNTSSAGLFFAPSSLQITDSYVSGLGTAAVYHATVSEAHAASASGLPPVATANGVPTTAGFATVGIICSNGTLSGCTPSIDLTTGKPTTCQAASTNASGNTYPPSGSSKTWALSTTAACTYGAAVGEPIELAITVASAGAPPGVTLGVPFNCDPSTATCSVSASAGWGTDGQSGATTFAGPVTAGGFSAPLDYLSGTSPDTFSALPLGPGSYTIEAIGSTSGDIAKGTLKLLPGPAS